MNKPELYEELQKRLKEIKAFKKDRDKELDPWCRELLDILEYDNTTNELDYLLLRGALQNAIKSIPYYKKDAFGQFSEDDTFGMITSNISKNIEWLLNGAYFLEGEARKIFKLKLAIRLSLSHFIRTHISYWPLFPNDLDWVIREGEGFIDIERLKKIQADCYKDHTAYVKYREEVIAMIDPFEDLLIYPRFSFIVHLE